MTAIAAAPPPAAAGAPGAAELADPVRRKIWQSAQDFEALAVGEMLQPMFDTVDPAHGALGGGDAEATWRPMLTQEIARQIERHGGLGLAVPVYRQMLHAQETR